MDLTYYIVLSILAFVCAYIFVIYWNKQIGVYYTLIIATIVVGNFGYMCRALSTNLSEALLANKIVYFGAAFLPLFLILVIFEICNMEVKLWIRNIMFGLSLCIFTLACTAGYTDIYYKSVDIMYTNGAAVLIKEYGPLHWTSNVLLCAYAFSGLALIIYTYVEKKNVSYINLLYLVAILLTNIVLVGIAKLCNTNLEIYPLVYLLDEILIVLLSRRIGMHNFKGTMVESLEYQDTYGYIMFNKQMMYLGCNEVALKSFPSLQELKIDYFIPNDNEFKHTVEQWVELLNESEKEATCYYENDDKVYKITIRHMYYGNSKCGYIVEFFDDTKQQKYIRLINRYNEELAGAVEKKTEHIQEIQDKVILGMANIIEVRDSSTGGHVKRTSEVIKILVEELVKESKHNVSKAFCKYVVKAAPMHDLGKITVEDDILRKPGSLTSEEYEEMKKHAAQGAKMVNELVKDIEDPLFTTIATDIAHYHHERYDGSGYPEGLVGEEIPFSARIMAIADVYDVLVCERCYKEKMSYEEAYNIILDSMGTHFDPSLRDTFVNSREKLEAYYNSIDL